jgi:acyl-coenzyme A thioesterase 9
MFHRDCAGRLATELYSVDGNRDIRFSGFVTYTGSSSMEVFVRMEGLGTQPGDESRTIMLGT